MSGWIVPPASRGEAGGRDPVERVEPGDRARTRARWERRTLQWRAVEIAEVVFGGPVEARLVGEGAGGFRGLVELVVPFDDLERHRRAEAAFVVLARRDEVLSRLPAVVVFTPSTPAER